MVDYLYYKKDYRGTVFCEKTEFERYEKRALHYINSVICGDIKNAEESAYYCICAVAEELCRTENSQNIKSESIDGYSVTYSADRNKQLYGILRMYLPAELLFKGVR